MSSYKIKSGSFQSMNLSKSVVRAIFHKGYKNPTPIQRKVIPVILEGRDVVAMARTGSGKTAAFLVPIVQKLQSHSAQIGVRAIVLSPTRELALQNYKFTREFTKYTNLKTEVILGGDSMEKQFASIHENPDILIATPGRLLHLAVEMNLKFNNVQFIVFDEADRLFELGFSENLNEIISRLPSDRQTLLFSATLPQVLVDFTKAGLNSPMLIRLDTENKIPDGLTNMFISCHNEDKLAVLIYLIQYVISPNETTIVFLPTRHHIEYVKEVFDHLNINATYLYSSLDMEARRLNISSFQSKKSKILLVTDLAARGVDIPLLNNVINFNFPSKPKLFVHRVGRTARAGCKGNAYSFISNDELPYLFSLNLFLNQSFQCADENIKVNEHVPDCIYGQVPQAIIEEQTELIEKLHKQFAELDSMRRVCTSAYKQYLKTRDAPSSESVKKAKNLFATKVGYHPILLKSYINHGEEGKTIDIKGENERINMLNSIKAYKPNATIFDIGKTKAMNGKSELIKGKKKQNVDKLKNKKDKFPTKEVNEKECFDSNIGNYKDGDFYLNYQSMNHHSEQGLKLEKSFNNQLVDAMLNIDGDERGKILKSKNQLKWDRKKKKFIQPGLEEKRTKKIKTESGNWIAATYKSGAYLKWKQKSKIEFQNANANDKQSN